MNDNHAQMFVQEAFELLSDLEVSLLELEDNPSDSELIGSVFRALHTIKGSGGMFGFDDIAHFTHTIETVFDDVRGGKLPVTRDLISLTLKAKDLIQFMLDRTSPDEAPAPYETQALIDSFQDIAIGRKSSGEALPTEESCPDTKNGRGFVTPPPPRRILM